MDQEMELLRSFPEPTPTSESVAQDNRGKSREEDDMWKLDAPIEPSGGPLLDPSGKVLSVVFVHLNLPPLDLSSTAITSVYDTPSWCI